MAQQELTIANMNAALPDNQAGIISPSDVRNAMATALGGYAGLIMAVGPSTMFLVPVTPIVISIWTALSPKSLDVNAGGATASLGTNDITIGESGVYFVSFYASFTTGNNNKTVQFQPFVNALPTSIKVLQRLSTGSDVQTTPFTGMFALTKDDVLDMRISVPIGGPDDVLFQNAAFSTFRVG
jgi:hypothetical protein